MLRRIGVASSTEIVITDVRIFGKAQRVFSRLDEDRDHICADFGSAGRAVGNFGGLARARADARGWLCKNS